MDLLLSFSRVCSVIAMVALALAVALSLAFTWNLDETITVASWVLPSALIIFAGALSALLICASYVRIKSGA